MKYIFIFLFGFSFTQAQHSPEWIELFYHSESSSELIENAAFDNSGNIYLSGYGHFVEGGQGHDFLTVKVNQDGNKEWSKIFNGTGNNTDRPYGLYADDSGNVYVTGTTRISNSELKIVTIKYAADGSIVWASVYDSASVSDGEAYAVTVDQLGYTYITGRFSTNQPVNNYNLITLKLDHSGNPVNWNYFDQFGNQLDQGKLILTDAFGDILVAGNSFANIENGVEAVLLKYNNNLDTIWTAHINGTDNSFNEFSVDIALDDTGNVYLLAWIQNDSTRTDFKLVKVSSTGTILWQNEYDANEGQDIPEAMAIDDEGNIFVTGRARRTGYNDMVILKYNNAGEKLLTTYYDGPNNLDDDPYDIELDNEGNIYICGESNRGGSGFKFIVIKLNAEGEFQWEYIYKEEENISSKAIKLKADNSGFIYAAGECDGPNNNYDLIVVKLSTITGIEETTNKIGNSFKLYQNFPNPFNPATKISWQLPVGSLVTLKIYDVLGKEIVTLIDEYKPGGEYETDFDASEYNLSSGIYFYSLKTENFHQYRKMVLLK